MEPSRVNEPPHEVSEIKLTLSRSFLKILFTFENPLPSPEADAEVFVNTARCLSSLVAETWLHVPLPRNANIDAIRRLAGMSILRAQVPIRPAILRHLFCGLTLPMHREYWQADLIYTRNLWIAWTATLFGRKVIFDHYRPWSDQIPPLRPWLYVLNCNRNFLINICHSNYTRAAYLGLGVPPAKLQCVRNGFAPQRLQPPVATATAKQAIGVPQHARTVIYTGRLNHKKGLGLVMEAAGRLPDLLFILVGSQGHGPIEMVAAAIPNVRIIAWQSPEALARYISAADILLIPPSSEPLEKFGSTVLPLKIFLYMASGRPILAGDTPDVREVLRHRENAFLCRPDRVEALVEGLRTLIDDDAFAATLAAAASRDSVDLTWEARARRIIDIAADRLRTPRQEQGSWGSTQQRAWLSSSARWLLHLMRTRSWVLPPDPARSVARSDAPGTGSG